MLNVFTCIGRLVDDPELKTTKSDRSMTNLRIAVRRDFSQKDEQETDFFDAVAWHSTAEFICRNFSKGKLICLIGRMQNREWTDKDGNKRVTAEIVVDRVNYAGDKAPAKKEDGAGQDSPFDTGNNAYPFGNDATASMPSPFDD